MNYIVENVVKQVMNNKPVDSGEAMFRIDGFEDIRIYEKIAQRLTKEFQGSKLSLDIKLTNEKWKYFCKNNSDSAALQSMKQNDWIAIEDSITYFRNLHTSNIVILLGTEESEDNGGLKNCYSITPKKIEEELKYHNYYDVFSPILENISDDECGIIDKLYKDLFEFVAIDICKMSKIADEWKDSVFCITDFVEIFFKTLPKWGLPPRIETLPSARELRSNRNILREEYNFISRTMFKKMSVTQYKKYQKKINEYNNQSENFASNWSGWSQQTINSYDEFANILDGYILGKNIELYKKKLLGVDFSIIEDVLGMQLPTSGKLPKKTIHVITGEPLVVFTTALLYSFENIKYEELDLKTIEFEFTSAELISMYHEEDSEDEKNLLRKTWERVCRHINGVFDYIAKREWCINEQSIEIACNPNDFFETSTTSENINSGRVKSLGANKKSNRIMFNVSYINSEGNKYKSNQLEFQWNFKNTSYWINAFADISEKYSELNYDGIESVIPMSIMKKMQQVLFSKSEEEFFDILDETNIDYEYNLLDYIQNKVDKFSVEWAAYYENLGELFVEFCKAIDNYGFYKDLCDYNSKILAFVTKYYEIGKLLLSKSIPENQKWVLDTFIHAFNIEMDENIIISGQDASFCIVPPWHPATLQKLSDQKVFFLDGCEEWWNNICQNESSYNIQSIDDMIYELKQMSLIQSSVDIFPSYGQQYFGSINTFGNYSIYGRNDIVNTSRLKDIIHKDAVFDDDFSEKEYSQMNDNAKLIYSVIRDYVKAFPDIANNLSLVFVDPSELQPIIAALHKYIAERKKIINDQVFLSIQLKILVKPENKGGRNYLSYWMDEFFSQDENVNIKIYLNEWKKNSDLLSMLNGNQDIVFVMDLLKVNNLQFVKDNSPLTHDISDCLFPIVYKPSPVSDTTVKRRIELTQSQFNAAFIHTQIVRYRNNMENVPDANYLAVREVMIDRNGQDIVYALHKKAYWVVCVDSGMDGALLRNDDMHKAEYSIIGFSTGKGAYGQYNLTITARKSILDSIRKRFEGRLFQLFKWNEAKIKKAAEVCMKEAGDLDGISLLSAINQRDNNINEFMAYVLTSLREKDKCEKCALKVVIHLDSYMHWFSGEVFQLEDNLKSRPDFLVLKATSTSDEKLNLKATIVECKISKQSNADGHKEKAIKQVKHGISRLSEIFNPDSKSVKKRYWYAQLYRALAFAQITFSNDSYEFALMASQLRMILDGKFSIEWEGKVLGYWVDMPGTEELVEKADGVGIEIFNIPQQKIQHILLNDYDEDISFVDIPDEAIYSKEQLGEIVNSIEAEIERDIDEIENSKINDDDIERIHDTTILSSSKGIKTTIGSIEKTNDKETKIDNIEGKEAEKKLSEIVIETVTETETETKTEAEAIDFQTKSWKLSDVRILIGNDKLHNNVFWEYGHPQLANRHMLITGTSGQGKTYSIQTMLLELAKSRISSVIFDYTEGFRIDQLEKPFKDKMGNKIIQHIIYFTGVPINPFKRHEIDVAGMKAPEKISDVAQRIANIFSHVYDFKEQQFSAIYEACRCGIEKYKDAMNMNYFKMELEESENKSAKTVLSKMAPFLDSVEFSPNGNFDWSEILYSKEGKVNIFQLTNFVREIQVIITEFMLWDIWHFTKKNGEKDKPFTVVLDEAQNLSHKSDSPSAMILTEGRKFGWSAWFATQSLKVLDDDEVVRLMQAAFKLYFKPTDDEIVRISKQLDPTNTGNWTSTIRSLQKGQCIVVGDRMKSDNTFSTVKPTVTNVSPFSERE